MFNFFDWLQVEINPNLIVAEISYDNNVVVCDLNYTGYYARIYNCKHEGLLQGEKDKMAGVKNNPIKYRYPFQFFFLRLFDYHSSCQPKTTRRAQTSMKVFCSEGFYLFWNFISIFVHFFFVPYALFMFYKIIQNSDDEIVWVFYSLQKNKTKTNTQPPKKSLCPIYHSLLTSCVVLIDHIALHIYQFCCHKTNISLVYYICTRFASFVSDSNFG